MTSSLPPTLKGTPEGVKPAIAAKMIERTVEAGVPFSWVAADSIYEVGEIEMALRRAGKGYVLGVTGKHQFWSWGKELTLAGTAEGIAKTLPSSFWQRLSAGSGTISERLNDWAYLELADLTAAEFGSDIPDVWTRGLLIRRSIVDASLAFFTTWCPAGTPIERLVRVEGTRWAIEDAFETAVRGACLDWEHDPCFRSRRAAKERADGRSAHRSNPVGDGLVPSELAAIIVGGATGLDRQRTGLGGNGANLNFSR